MNLFEGLEALGFDNVNKQDIYVKERPAAKANAAKADQSIEDCLYRKSYTCPVCDKKFEDTTYKKGRLRYISSDMDLKPYYEPIDPLYYDVVMCHHCGYAAVASLFNKLMERQADMIRTQITPRFKYREYPMLLSVELAAERYKMALLNSVIKSAKSGEKAYLCLKLSWIYKDMNDSARQKLFVENAYKGFKDAYQTEDFPICGIDEPTVSYLIGKFAWEIGNRDEALRWIGKVIIQKDANVRLKNKAMDIKELIHGR